MACDDIRDFNSAVILAGGRSTRMGFDKQLLSIDGKRIVQKHIDLLKTRFGDIMVSSYTPELYEMEQVRVISDVYEDVGPLGGIHSALVNAQSNAVFLIACDMPLLSLDYIDYMVSRMKGQKVDACVTRYRHHLEFFHAFFCKSALPLLEEQLDAGQYSVKNLVKKLNALIIAEKDAQPYTKDWSIFTSLNTLNEYNAYINKTIS